MAWNDDAQIACRFAFTCPQQWSKLQPTETDDVRHCAACNRDVHLALTEADLRRHCEQGHCIAVPLAREEEAADHDELCWVVGRVMPPYGAESEEDG